MNSFRKALETTANLTYTENGALTHKTSNSALLDLFALGGAYRSRSDVDCIKLFIDAYYENPEYALKCLFYLRDRLEGQGERRFFRVCMHWLAQAVEVKKVERLIPFIPLYGRWDDLYCFVGTDLEKAVFNVMREQLEEDMTSPFPSLLAKWLKSPNASSAETRKLATITRTHFNMSERDYRRVLSSLRERIKVVEKLMSANRWDEIEFDKMPSRAGILYRNAFARRDMVKERYKAFAADSTTKVNASVLYPFDVVHDIFKFGYYSRITETDIQMLQKYWDNLPDVYQGREENAIAVVDVSGSMTGTPMEVAISMGLYVAEKSQGAFSNMFITFSDIPSIEQITGNNIVEKTRNLSRASWGYSTNIEAVFNLLLATAQRDNVPQEDIPKRVYIFSDMEFNSCIKSRSNVETLFEIMDKRWSEAGYEMPQCIFWNLAARHDNIPALGRKFSYVSGFSPVMIDTIFSGKTGYELMMEKLDSSRYKEIY